jgi:transcriptional regulator with XRE-family HTH domain
MKVLKKKLGKNIVNIRKEKGISQEKLGELANLHRTYIGSVERGERNISLEAMVKISKALEVEIIDLFVGINVLK